MYNWYKWLTPSLLLILQRNALRYRVCLSQVNYVSQISHAYREKSPGNALERPKCNKCSSVS